MWRGIWWLCDIETWCYCDVEWLWSWSKVRQGKVKVGKRGSDAGSRCHVAELHVLPISMLPARFGGAGKSSIYSQGKTTREME